MGNKDKTGTRRNVYMNEDTRQSLIDIGMKAGAKEGRAASLGLRISAAYHERLRELLGKCSTELAEEIEGKYHGILGYPSTDRDYRTDMAVVDDARALLTEIEEAGR